jgi:hypothetical protein
MQTVMLFFGLTKSNTMQEHYTAIAVVGITALLAGAIGQVAADVMMVIMASIAGCVITLSGNNETRLKQALLFFIGALLTSLVLAWSLTAVLGAFYPPLNSSYTPTIIAFVIGSQATRLHVIADRFTNRTVLKEKE